MSEDKEKILKQLNRHYDIVVEYYKDQRKEGKKDFKFRKGDQWDERDKEARENSGRPAEVYNKLGQFVKQVVNNQKMNRPEINVKAGDSSANFRTAQLMQSIIKNIQTQSFFDNIIDTAFDCAATCGEGYFRIKTDYKDPLSFDQDIYFEAIDDYSSVYIDPNFKTDYSNLNYAFVTTTIPKEEFEEKYPDSAIIPNDYRGYTDDEWVDEDNVKLVEYFYVTKEEKEIHLLDNDIIVYDEDYQKMKNKPGIKKSRKTTKRVVNWTLSNGYEILEENVFPGELIPIIPVFGDMFVVDGKKYFEGIIRQARSSQVKMNYFLNIANEVVGLLGKAKYIMPEGSLEGHEYEWNNMHNSANPVLQYKPLDLNGNGVNPMPMTFSTPIDTLSAAIAQADQDLKSTTGIYDPSLGTGKNPESSGIALMTKQRQSEVTSFMFIDNLSKSLKLAGQILLNIIPLLYDNDRIIRIQKQNSSEDELVKISDELDVNFQMGKYTCEVTIGPAGENQRQEAVEAMLALMNAYPDITPNIADIWLSKQDWAGAQEISERLKKLLPAQLQDDAQPQIPEEIQQQVMQKEQEYQTTIQEQTSQMQEMQKLISDLTSQVNTYKNRSEIDSMKVIADERKNSENNQVKLLIEMMKQGLPVDLMVKAMNVQLNGEANQNVPTPQMDDTIVLPGVNDPITEQTQETPIDNLMQQQQQQEQEVDPRDDLLSKLQQNLTEPSE